MVTVLAKDLQRLAKVSQGASSRRHHHYYHRDCCRTQPLPPPSTNPCVTLFQPLDPTASTGPTDSETDTHLSVESATSDEEESLLVKVLPALILLAFFVIGVIIVRIYLYLPEGAPRFCLRIFSWPVLQSAGSGLMRQNVALGNGSARSKRLAVGMVSYCIAYEGPAHAYTDYNRCRSSKYNC